MINFGSAIVALKAGYPVARRGWNGKGMYLQLQVPDAHSKMTLPYIFMKTADDNLVPWLASQTDMLSDDWEIHVISPGTPLRKAPPVPINELGLTAEMAKRQKAEAEARRIMGEDEPEKYDAGGRD